MNPGRSVYIAKMPLVPIDTTLPFDFQHLQFAIRLAFAISIYKGSLDFVSIRLGNEVEFFLFYFSPIED